MIPVNKPTLILYPDRVRQNIERMARKAAESGIRFRPHFKTHQSRVVGQWFRDIDVQAITVSSMEMALYFAKDGWDDIAVAFPVNLREIAAINELARQVKLTLLLEDEYVVQELDRQLTHPVDICIKVDVGTRRTGMPADDPEAILHVANAVKTMKNGRFQGLLAHTGHTYQARSVDEIRSSFRETVRQLQAIRTYLRKGDDEILLSVGDTPSCNVMERFEGIDEIRPGNFVFYDLMQWKLGSCLKDQIGILMACPVVAKHADRGEVVLYGGAVHFSKEAWLINGKTVFGQMVQVDASGYWTEFVEEAYLTKLSQEHGILEVPQTIMNAIKPGDWVGIIPVHACLTANLMRGYHLPDGSGLDHMNEI